MPMTEPSRTMTPSATSERAPTKQLSSMITGLACSGSSTPPMPTPPERWQCLPIWAQEPTVVQVSTMVGSCAQIGKHCHLSGGVGIGGVLEPLQAGPVIIEDNCFIGARSEVAEGVIVGEGSVLSMGVYLGQSTKIVDRETGEIFYGKVPPYSVVVAGTMGGGN